LASSTVPRAAALRWPASALVGIGTAGLDRPALVAIAGAVFGVNVAILPHSA
jgi:hypothetical protein